MIAASEVDITKLGSSAKYIGEALPLSSRGRSFM
jgi:hypothetical protein